MNNGWVSISSISTSKCFVLKSWIVEVLMYVLEIKTFSLVLEFEIWRCLWDELNIECMLAEVAGLISCSSEVIAKIWLDPLRGFWDHWTTFINSYFQKIYSFMPLFLPPEEDFWPLTASILSPVKNNYDHVTMGWILNKISKKKFSVRCMILLWLFQVPRPLKILIRLLYRYFSNFSIFF